MRSAAPAETEIVDVPVSLGGLEAAAAQYGVTASALVQATWHVLLSRMAGAEVIAVPTMSLERAHAELESAVGLFARPFPLVSRPSPALAGGEFAAQLQRSREVAERWQDYAPAALMRCRCRGGFVEMPRSRRSAWARARSRAVSCRRQRFSR